MTSNLERSTEIFRKHKLKYWKVEYRNIWAKKTIDLFNIFDILVLDSGIIGIQVFGGGGEMQKHIRKLTIKHADYTREWLKCGGLIELHGWRRVKVKRGGKAMVWKCRVADILLVNGELMVEHRDK